MSQENKQPLHAGLRSSSYGISPFPSPNWWVASTSSMAARFPGAAPSVVWIVGIMQSSTDCRLNFPSPGGDYAHVQFNPTDENEVHLAAFDRAGVKVWLQVEPTDADVSALVDLVMARYSHHPSVIGFGVDVEWYQIASHQEGKAVTDAEARTWSERVRSYNPNYLLFVKHWLSSKLPPAYRTGMAFVDDSQQFASLDEMVREFAVWGRTFAPAGVGFQVGYKDDQKWWGSLADPPKDVGRALLDKVPNTTDLYWVDFSAYDIWPAPHPRPLVLTAGTTSSP